MLSTIARLAGSIAEWAGSAVIGELISMGFSYLGNRKLPANGVAELKRIEAALPQIKDAMSIAEALKMKDPSFCQWVEKFRLAVEASEDVLDELEYKRLEDIVKGRDEAGGSASSSKKRKSCSINDDTLERLKEVVKMLDQAANGVEHLLQASIQFGIQNLSDSRQEASKVFSRETTSFLVERELFGREVEKHKIIDWLKRPTDARLSSFGIVGVGGLGKTTLVQFAYQEMRGSNHFDKTIWVCVSTNFSVEDITRKMLGELGENNCNNKPLNTLQENLKENTHLKKILLVLDDIWDDEKRSDWDQLFAPLRFVQEGSKILFTTRMKSVADLLASVISTEHESLSLQGLGEQELRSLFQSYAFRGFNLDNHGDLQAIGDQILKMLRGSPLAAKVIGSLLNSRMDYQYWRRVLDQGSLFNLEQAKDVVEVLKLSYYHLPANLQVCFRFCSIFPQDHQFDKDDLIKMWICSGFIRQQSSFQEKRPEDIGEDYFNLLLRKSLFEYVESRTSERRYVMHDLVHELAQNVSYGECCRIERNDKSITIPSTVRHVYVHEHETEKVSHLENIRSLVVTTYHLNTCSFVLPKNLIKKRLRLLKICRSGYGNREGEMPKEIRSLVHLRYLSVEGSHYVTDESFKYLPLVYKLYHLQVLVLEIPRNYSYNSAIETTGMTNLLKLRYMRLPKEIMQTIHGVHKLTSLQELTFFVGQESGQRINELGTLKNLRHMIIENIENIGDHTEAKSANLFEKNNLMSLYLKWTSKSNPIHPEKIIDNLQPPPSLMELTINHYNGQRSPHWMDDSQPLNLSSLKLFNCPLWKNQLFSGKTPYLKILDIRDCLNIDTLPHMPLSLIEFRISKVGWTSLPALYQNYGNNTPVPLSLKSSLRVVEIENCPNLISLHGFLQQDNLDLRAIEKLTINGCERLVHMPTHGFGNLMSLKYLTLTNNPKLVAMDFQGYLLPTELQQIYMGNCGELDLPVLGASYGITTLTELKLQNANFISIAAAENSFRSLKSLNIRDCPNLIELSMARLTALETLQIWNADLLENLPELPASLRKLYINGASSLKSLPTTMARLTALENLQIVNANLLENLPELPASLRELYIFGTSSLKSLPATMVRLIALENLEIMNADLLENLPELPASLRHLYIDGASSLKSLLVTMARLTALKNLTILNADLLENLPELPASLRMLYIGDASSLKSLPTTMARLTALETLQISKADLLENLPELPASLRHLYINGASSLKSLPATMARLTALESLQIVNANLLENLPELPASLRELYIDGASFLKSLPATMVRLIALENLEISKADLLENLPELPASLRYLYINGASSLKSLPATMARLTAVQNLVILKAALLENLPELPASLRMLYIGDASSLKSLPTTMARLTALETLQISKADLLENLPELPASLKNKKIEGRGGRFL